MVPFGKPVLNLTPMPWFELAVINDVGNFLIAEPIAVLHQRLDERKIDDARSAMSDDRVRNLLSLLIAAPRLHHAK